MQLSSCTPNAFPGASILLDMFMEPYLKRRALLDDEKENISEEVHLFIDEWFLTKHVDQMSLETQEIFQAALESVQIVIPVHSNLILILQNGIAKSTTRKIHPKLRSNVFIVPKPMFADITIEWPACARIMTIRYGRFTVEIPIQNTIRNRRIYTVYYSLTADAVWNAFIHFQSPT